MHLFSSHWKHQKTLRFSVFRGVETGRIGNKWVKNLVKLHIAAAVIKTVGNFSLNFVAFIKFSMKTFWHPYSLKIWSICTCTNRDLSLLFTVYKPYDVKWNWNFHGEYSLINEVGKWVPQLGYVSFSESLFWSVNYVLPFYQN